ncbi:MAG TPA: ComEC family competence protein, partial [Anaerolineae bacterium]
MTPLIRVGIAWTFGIALARWLELPWFALGLVALPAAGGLLLYWSNPRARWFAILALAFLAGIVRLNLAEPGFDETHVAFYNDAPAPTKITGVVADEPDIRDQYINLRLQVESITAEGESRPIKGLVLVRAPRYPERFYGDRLAIKGQLETPPIFEDFSYKDYLARFGIHAMVRRPYIDLIESNQGNIFWAGMLAFKYRASQTINRILAEPYASLLNGILLGVETGIPRGLYEQFNLTGTSHIIVISGSNISLVAGLLLLFGQRAVGQRWAP